MKVNTYSNSSIPWLFLAIRKTFDIRGRSMLFWSAYTQHARKKPDVQILVRPFLVLFAVSFTWLCLRVVDFISLHEGCEEMKWLRWVFLYIIYVVYNLRKNIIFENFTSHVLDLIKVWKYLIRKRYHEKISAALA